MQEMLVATIHDPKRADEFAKRFTPYDGARRRVVAKLLRLAADEIDHGWPRPSAEAGVPLTPHQRGLAKTRLWNVAAPGALAGELGPGDRRRMSRDEAVGPLEAARMVVRLGLGECIRCEAPGRQALSGRTPFYCGSCRRDGAESDRSRDRDRMHTALERLVALLGVT